MRKNIQAVCITATLVALLTESSWGFTNNGFQTDYAYALQTNGRLTARLESDGSNMGQLVASSTYVSLTFSGTGTNDARLFVVGPTSGSTTDLTIAELNSTGGIVQQRNLSAILGQQPGSKILTGNIRYNPFRNSLIVSANPNSADISSPAKAWEVDLGLSALYNTYTGPACGFESGTTTARSPMTSINTRTGAMYMMCRSQGDLIAFDTLNPASPYTTLISAATVGDANWVQPKAPIYRDARLLNNGLPASDDTVLTLLNRNSGVPQNEYYLYQGADANGNLIKRGSPINGNNSWLGQQDRISGDIWFGNYSNGLFVLRANDTVQSFQTTAGWWDVGSPAPEPVTLMLLALGGTALLRRRRSM